MRDIKRTGKLTISLLIALIVCMMCGVSAFALEVPDPDATGSISVTLKDPSTKKTATDGSLIIYKVGDMYENDGDYSWLLTQDFVGSKADLSDLGNEKMVQVLYSYVLANSSTIKPVSTADIGTDGTARFSGLGVGLYMAVQSAASTGYKPIMPFLVTIPMKNESDGTWYYDVDASPKVEIETATPTPTPTTKITPTPTPTTKRTITPKPSITRRVYVTTTVKRTTLPKTGQLWWPVGLLAVVGIVLVFVGVSRKSKS